MSPIVSKKKEFKYFTPDSLKEIENRISINKELEAQRLIAEAEENTEDPTTTTSTCLGKIKSKIIKKKKRRQLNDLRPDKELLTGNNLPDRMRARFPAEMYGVPIEEIDDYNNLEHGFVVVNKSGAIFRFSAKNALFVLSPFNPIRRLAVFILTHPIFSALVMLTILANCVVMTIKHPPEFVEYVFTVIYTSEALMKILARGFILDNNSFLRDPWNWLDFIVISLAYATMLIKSLGNMSVLRTLRVLRALKTVAIVPGLKTIVDALVQSVFRLRDVMILTAFVLSVFALIGLQLYMGVLRRKCVYNPPSNLSHIEYHEFITNSTNWVLRSGNTILCGNSSLASQCDNGTTCFTVGDNPNSGYTSFDSYMFAMLGAFRLMTQDYWENLYTLILTTEGPVHFFFFLFVIFFGSFYLINLILAIVALSYGEQQEKAIAEAIEIEKKRLQEEEENAAIHQAEMDAENLEEKAIQAADSCSHELLPRDDTKPENIKNANGNLCQLSDTAAHPANLDNGTPNMTPIHQRRDSINTQLTWNYEKTNNQTRSAQLKSIQYADDVSTCTQSTLKHSKNEEPDNQSNLNDDDDEDTESLKTIVIQPNSVALLDIPNSAPKNNGSGSTSRISRERSPTHQSPSPRQLQKYLSPKERFKNALFACFCAWDCWPPFVTIQKYVGYFILDAFVDLFIIICILLNTLFMAMDHHDMDETFAAVLSVGNYIFTAIFATEAFLKIIALTPRKYFLEGWNVFDIIIVILSLVELGLQGVKGLSVLRSFRLLRVFKLAKSWPTLNRLIMIIGKTVGALGNLTFVLVIVLFIFAVVGMQLFGESYEAKKDEVFGGEVPRWSFVDFFHSFMIVFRVLCGEWIESMWDCLNVVGWPCVPFFLCTKIIGGLVVLNLFLALLLSAFGGGSLQGSSDSEDADNNKILIAVDRITRFIAWVKKTIREKICCCLYKKKRKNNLGSIELMNGHEELSMQESKLNPINLDDPIIEMVGNGVSEDKQDPNRRKSLKNEEYLPNCFSDQLNSKFKKVFKCCYGNEQSKLCQNWTKIRRGAYDLAENKNFELFIILMIVLSSIALALEDKFINEKPLLKKILGYGDDIFTVIFAAEMILKWVGYGFRKYFSDGWCWLDFIIVSVACMGICASLLGYSDIQVFKTMRTLRALRPLRALSRFEGIRVVVNALLGSIPSVFNVMIVCLIFWLIFGIMGVQLFAGKFYKCVYPDLSRLKAEDEVHNKTECLSKGYVWYNSRINFDNTMNAYLALLQVATFKGWVEIIADATDISPEPGLQPKREQNLAMMAYFVIFIVFGSFFTLNLFIGVIIDNFNQQKKKLGGSSLDLLMTDSQKKYYQAMKKMGSKKPQKALPRPKFPVSRFFFDITSNQKFDIFIMACILLNMVAMCLEHYDQSETFETVLAYINYVFIAIFTMESMMKLIAINWRYFKIAWNVFDFVIVIFSILGLAFENFIKSYLSVSPTVLRVVRVARVGRVLRLVKGAKGIRTLLFALAISLPALVNIGLLLFLIIFIYAIFGMNFFMHVGYSEGTYTPEFNFQNIYRSLITLFPLVTSGGWSVLLDGITHEAEPKCDPTMPTSSQLTRGNCGSKALAVPFLVTYVVITFLVVINMYIAVILENFNTAREEVQQGLTDDDYDMYYETWQKFDPKCTEFIALSKLSDFVDILEPPLRVPKPNKYKLISMDISICANNEVHCMDILDALTKDYLNAGEETDPDIPEIAEKKERPSNYNPITSTFKIQREDICARIITKSIKTYAKKCRERKDSIKRKTNGIAHSEDLDDKFNENFSETKPML